ncbi:hypothetical protein Tco_1317034 [Tanacetum coccineum]
MFLDKQTRTQGFHTIGVYQSLKRILKHEGLLGFYNNTLTALHKKYVIAPLVPHQQKFQIQTLPEDGNYRDAIKLVIQIKESGLKPEFYSYLIAMTAVVKELNELGKALRKLKGFTKTGLTFDLDEEDTQRIQNYQSGLLKDGVCLSNWVIEEGGPSFSWSGL